MKKTTIATVLTATLFAAVPPSFAQTTPTQVGVPAERSVARPLMPLTHIATGTVRVVDTAQRTVVIAHLPVPSLNWPAMTMSFKFQEPVSAEVLPVGKDVTFNFVQAGSDYVITAAQPAAANVASSSGKPVGHDMPDMKGHGMGQMTGMGGMMDMCEGMMSGMTGGPRNKPGQTFR